MQFIKQLQILLLKNIKIIISVLLIISLSSIIFYLDLFNLNFLNKQDIIDLKTELLEEKEDLNLEKKENLNNIDNNNNNNNMIYYAIGSAIFIVGCFFLWYYYKDGPNNPDLIKESFDEILSRIKETDQKCFNDKCNYSGRPRLVFRKRAHVPEEISQKIGARLNRDINNYFPTISIDYIRSIWYN